MSSSVHIDNILVLGIGPAPKSDDTTLTAEAKYSINFLESNKKYCLSLHYNENNSFLLVKV